jgi:hypothetical protein
MMKFLYLACAGVAVFAGTAAFSADNAGQFAVRGAGGLSCSVWADIANGANQEQQRDGILTFQSWLAGYITASNRLSPDTYDAMPYLDMVNVLAIVLNECRANPGELVEFTASRVLLAFSSARVVQESPLVTVPDAGAEKTYRQSTIVLVQQKLIDRGLLSGRADGVPGAGTATALRAFQKQAGLPETGEISVDTVFRLLLNL